MKPPIVKIGVLNILFYKNMTIGIFQHKTGETTYYIAYKNPIDSWDTEEAIRVMSKNPMTLVDLIDNLMEHNKYEWRLAEYIIKIQYTIDKEAE